MKRKTIMLIAIIVIIVIILSITGSLVVNKAIAAISKYNEINAAKTYAINYIKNDTNCSDSSSIDTNSIKVSEGVEHAYTVTGSFTDGYYTWILSLYFNGSGTSNYSVLLCDANIASNLEKQKEASEAVQSWRQERLQDAQGTLEQMQEESEEAASEESNIGTIPDSSNNDSGIVSSDS